MLPEEYRPNFGLSVGLDGMLCGMLVAHADLIERMLAVRTNQSCVQWLGCLSRPRK